MMVLAIMPDTATAAKKVDTGSNLSTSTWNTISILGNIIEVPQCDQTSWKVEDANFIVASKTNSEKDKGFIVWTVNELNERAMADIINAIGQKSTWADFKKLDDNKLPVTFVYGDTSKLEGLIQNAVIKPVENDIQIDFSAEKVWTKYMYGNYIYIPEPTTIVLTANKLLKNESDEEMKLNGGEFTFVLKGGAEDVYTTNDANGDISFTIYFDEPGDYDYTIMEVDGQQPGYSYDSSEFEYTVEVVDNEGQLVA
jgi:pilin isopeptide linkage protein